MQNPLPHNKQPIVILIKNINNLFIIMREKLYTRRQTIGLLASMAIASSCMPVKLIFNPGKESEKNHDPTLRAFSEVIIPEAKKDEPGFSDIFYDKYYPFLQYIEILAEDLDKVSRRKYKNKDFSDLSFTDRTHIVESRLTDKGLFSAIYFAAIYLIQLSYFTGIYNQHKGCDLIGFQCEDQITDSYQDIAYFQGDPSTHDGNPS